jgi:hypothetical protein
MKLLAISIDLDEIPCYTAIHGLPVPDESAARAIYLKAVPRYEALFEELGARGTFFAVGQDLQEPHAALAIARLHRAGHEIGNHSFHHRYDLSRRDAATIRQDIADGSTAIAAVTGQAPRGFRAPGYTVTDALLHEAHALGVRYDSSVFPCPPYYGAKALAMGAIALRGRTSKSVLDTPRVLTAPTDPYRIGAHYTQRGEGLLELPIGVTSRASGQLPFIGTSVALSSQRTARWLARRIAHRPLVNFELHGIDLCDAEEDGLQFLAPHQVDLRRTLAHKRASLVAAIRGLVDAGYELVTLAQAAERF